MTEFSIVILLIVSSDQIDDVFVYLLCTHHLKKFRKSDTADNFFGQIGKFAHQKRNMPDCRRLQKMRKKSGKLPFRFPAFPTHRREEGAGKFPQIRIVHAISRERPDIVARLRTFDSLYKVICAANEITLIVVLF